MATKELIEKYFQGIRQGGWESYIADDFTFANGNLDNTVHGKAAYLEGAGRFFRSTTAVDVRQMLIQDQQVAVLARYSIRTPKGRTGICDVAEFLTVEGGKLTASTIMFDTEAFAKLMAQD